MSLKLGADDEWKLRGIIDVESDWRVMITRGYHVDQFSLMTNLV